LAVNYDDSSIESILRYAKIFKDKTLRDIMSYEVAEIVSDINAQYGTRRKGNFGNLVEEYIFGYSPNNDSQADFHKVGLELKTTPLKKLKNRKLVSKERLVFSMIDYMNIINETWEESSFLSKNKLLLLLFYLYEENLDILDYKFKIIHLLNLIEDLSESDILQIKKDWETIVNKIKNGDAHLLSEADTLYLGAATKASSSADRRRQPNNDELAKPRAFSLKQTYLNSIVQTYLGEEDKTLVSLTDDESLPPTIEENIESRFKQYLGKTNIEIEKEFDIIYKKRPKSHRRLLLNKIFGTNSNKIKELEKANITMRVLALEPSGRLTESISFPIFKYCDIIHEDWEESDFYEQLTTKRFLFIIFKKNKDASDTLEKLKFWNFPMQDMPNAKWVWEETVQRIKDKKANDLPGIKENSVAHVRPHARNKDDVLPTCYGTYEVKKCFWLNAKYIQEQLKNKE